MLYRTGSASSVTSQSSGGAPKLPDWPNTPERRLKYRDSLDELESMSVGGEELDCGKEKEGTGSNLSYFSIGSEDDGYVQALKIKADIDRKEEEEERRAAISPKGANPFAKSSQEKRLYILRQMAIYRQPPNQGSAGGSFNAKRSRGKKIRRDRYNSAPIPDLSEFSISGNDGGKKKKEKKGRGRKSSLPFPLRLFRRSTSSSASSSSGGEDRQKTYAGGRKFRRDPKFEYSRRDVRRLQNGAINNTGTDSWTRAHSHSVESFENLIHDDHCDSLSYAYYDSSQK